jgi:hypothetical protein
MGPKVVNQRPEKFDMGSFLTEPPCRRVSFLKKPPRIQREIAYEISNAHQIIVVLRIFPHLFDAFGAERRQYGADWRDLNDPGKRWRCLQRRK